MSYSLEPESSKKLEGFEITKPSLNETETLLMNACEDLLQAQNKELQSLSSALSPRQLESHLEQHRQDLFEKIENTPETKNLSQSEQENFILNQITQQKEKIKNALEQVKPARLATRIMQQASICSEMRTNTHIHPQLNQNVLDIDGVSVYVWTAPNGEKLYFPVGHSTEGGDNTTPSEAWGYAMRNAIASNDKAFFQQLTQSYLYFCNQSIGFGHPFGLMGWNPDMTTGSFDNNGSYATSASDADEDIIRALIDGYKAFGDSTITDPTSPTAPGTHSSISIKDLALQACQSFIGDANTPNKGDIGQFSINGKTYNPVLTLDSWGHDAVFPDYFDPTTFGKIISFLNDNNQNGQYSQSIDRLKLAAKNTMQFVFDIAQGSNGWIPDNPYQYPAQANNFGYDATRILMRLGEFIATPGAEALFGNDVYNQAVTVLKNLVNNIMPQVDGNGHFSPSGLVGGCFSGPFLLALEALKKIGQLPGDINQSAIDKIDTAFQNDIKTYDIHDGTKGWQYNGYFNIQIGTLSEEIMKNLGIYPN